MPDGRLTRVPRRLSAQARPLPNLLVVGGIRCGSSSLHDYLVANGATGPVGMAGHETHYFDRSPDRGPNWMRAWYPLRHGELVVDTSPSYLCTPGVAERAARTVPDARILAVLRHPYERATSHFDWRRRAGVEPAPTLADAIEDEPRRMTDARSMLGCYALHSRYEVGLAQWLDHFPAERLCVLVAERLFDGDVAEFDRLHTFLGLRRSAPYPHSNAGARGTRRDPSDDLANSFSATIVAVEALTGRSTGWAS